jgi:hypothetical protein
MKVRIKSKAATQPKQRVEPRRMHEQQQMPASFSSFWKKAKQVVGQGIQIAGSVARVVGSAVEAAAQNGFLTTEMIQNREKELLRTFGWEGLNEIRDRYAEAMNKREKRAMKAARAAGKTYIAPERTFSLRNQVFTGMPSEEEMRVMRERKIKQMHENRARRAKGLKALGNEPNTVITPDDSKSEKTGNQGALWGSGLSYAASDTISCLSAETRGKRTTLGFNSTNDPVKSLRAKAAHLMEFVNLGAAAATGDMTSPDHVQSCTTAVQRTLTDLGNALNSASRSLTHGESLSDTSSKAVKRMSWLMNAHAHKMIHSVYCANTQLGRIKKLPVSAPEQ